MFKFGYNDRRDGLFANLGDPQGIGAIARRAVPTAAEPEEEERRRRGSGLLSNLGMRIFGDDNRFFGTQGDGTTFRDRMMMAGLSLQGDGRGALAVRQGIQERQAEQAQAQEQQEQLRRQREQIVRQGQALGLQGRELTNFMFLPEDVRNEMLSRHYNPEAPEAPETRTVTRGGETVTEQWNAQTGQYEEIGRAPRWNPNAGPLVNVNTGEGQQPSPYAAAYEAATEARTESILTDIGPAAERRALQLDRLDGLLAANETGIGAAARLYASDFGLEIGDNVGELQAARALINTLVPELRPPNSGTFTDADARLARESLPRLINTPGGNELVMGTLRRINDYDRQLYRLTQQVGRGEITPQQYEDAVSALANPLDPVRQALNGTRADQGSDGPAPTRITSDDEYDRLPSGTLYIGPDGITRRKP